MTEFDDSSPIGEEFQVTLRINPTVEQWMEDIIQAYDFGRSELSIAQAVIRNHNAIGISPSITTLERVGRGEINQFPINREWVEVEVTSLINDNPAPEVAMERQRGILHDCFDLIFSENRKGYSVQDLLSIHSRLGEISGVNLPIEDQLSLLVAMEVSEANVSLQNADKYFSAHVHEDELGRFPLDLVYIGGGIDEAREHLTVADTLAELEIMIRKAKAQAMSVAEDDEVLLEHEQRADNIFRAAKLLTLFWEYLTVLGWETDGNITMEQLHRFSYMQFTKECIASSLENIRRKTPELPGHAWRG